MFSTFTTLKARPIIYGGIDDTSWNPDGACSLVEDGLVSDIRRTRARVGVNGRLHAITVTAVSSDDAETPLYSEARAPFGRTYYPYRSEVHQLTASFRDTRSRA